ncbi:hypothetical protein I8752_30990 [Nostocaceae cyanobacterium CENA369]|uniref:Uncharacterized protein n=1 Tax=Dendronalium phyllosphericum CENA369 TaxID=1725256 RepID=A0A8J7LHG6_9NOST|nr:hypothetical protein [Dendronalium phyllosphericum]MBH8577316.1 hypothetical protein [Dendronalium phyllosphericum CENA369]
MSNQAIYSLSSRLPQWVTHTTFGFDIWDLKFWMQKLSYKASLGISNNITYLHLLVSQLRSPSF